MDGPLPRLVGEHVLFDNSNAHTREPNAYRASVKVPLPLIIRPPACLQRACLTCIYGTDTRKFVLELAICLRDGGVIHFIVQVGNLKIFQSKNIL